jgi:hypothetical protein
MGELVDTPIMTKKLVLNGRLFWAALTGTILILTNIAWGAKSIYVGSVDPIGLEVDVQYKNDVGTGPLGEFLYKKNQPLVYSVLLKNRGQKSADVEVESSLHSDTNLEALLPGNSISASHRITVMPGSDYSYDVTYDADLPTSGDIQIRIQYSDQGHLTATTLTCQAHFIIQ